jgi:hypothetical protein
MAHVRPVDQVSGFTGFFGLVLLGATGLIAIGRPTAATGSGPALSYLILRN